MLIHIIIYYIYAIYVNAGQACTAVALKHTWSRPQPSSCAGGRGSWWDWEGAAHGGTHEVGALSVQ